MEMAERNRNIRRRNSTFREKNMKKHGRTVNCCQHLRLLEGTHGSGGYRPADLLRHEQRREPEQVPQIQGSSGTLGILFKALVTVLTHGQINSLFCAVSLLTLCLFLAHLAQKVLRSNVRIPLCFGNA